MQPWVHFVPAGTSHPGRNVTAVRAAVQYVTDASSGDALVAMTAAANELVAGMTYEGEAARVGRAIDLVAAGLPTTFA